jgi:hypothetical protein
MINRATFAVCLLQVIINHLLNLPIRLMPAKAMETFSKVCEFSICDGTLASHGAERSAGAIATCAVFHFGSFIIQWAD